MATVSESGWPYVQHRGGPPGVTLSHGDAFSVRGGLSDEFPEPTTPPCNRCDKSGAALGTDGADVFSRSKFRHENLTASGLTVSCGGVAAGPTCPKLQSYWHFHGCRYDKISRTCSEPDHIDGCPLPTHPLRNGRLNQMAYSLFLFVRDIADGDLVGWIDRQFQNADDPDHPNRLARLREALIGPLRQLPVKEPSPAGGISSQSAAVATAV